MVEPLALMRDINGAAFQGGAVSCFLICLTLRGQPAHYDETRATVAAV